MALPLMGRAATAGVPPIPPRPVEFHADATGPDCIIAVISSTTASLGRAVEWINDDGVDPHTISEAAQLWSIALDPDETVARSATAAGTFRQRCDSGPQQAWKVRLKAKARPANPDFKVAWAIAGAKAFWRYNVQFQIGDGSWRTWRSSTSAKSSTFDGASGRTYRFRSRVINSNTAQRSGFSPTRKVVT